MNIANIIGGFKLFTEMNSDVTQSITFIFWNIVISIILYFISTNVYPDKMKIIDALLKEAEESGDIDWFSKYIYFYGKYTFSDGFLMLFISGIIKFIGSHLLPSSMTNLLFQVILITIYFIFYIFDIMRYPEWPLDFPPGWKKTPIPLTTKLLNKIRGYF